VRFQVAQVLILCPVFFLVRHVDQQVEAIAIGVDTDYRLELLFVQQEQFLDGFAKSVQKIPALATVCQAGFGVFPFRTHTVSAHA
jgi:hypothetical protein